MRRKHTITGLLRSIMVGAIMVAAYANGNYFLVELPQQKAAALTKAVSDATVNLGQYQSYLEGYSAALEIQSTAGQVDPKVLEHAEHVALDADARVEKAEVLYASVEKEAQGTGCINRTELYFGRITAVKVRALLSDFRQEVADVHLSDGVKSLTTQLQEEEVIVVRTIDTLSHQAGDPMSPEQWSSITQEREHVSRLLQKVQKVADSLNGGKIRLCAKHRKAFRQTLEELGKKATVLKVLKRQLDEIHRADQTAYNPAAA